MFHASRNMRELLIKNFKIFKKINKYVTPTKVNDFDHTAIEQFGLSFKVYQKLLSIINQDVQFKRFKRVKREWVSTMIQRKDAFREIYEDIKPPFVLMSHFGEKWHDYKSNSFYMPYGQIPNADILVFLKKGLPNPANLEDASYIDHWIKMDRKNCRMIVHSKQPYKVSFSNNLTLRIER